MKKEFVIARRRVPPTKQSSFFKIKKLDRHVAPLFAMTIPLLLILFCLSACTLEPMYGTFNPGGPPSVGSNLSDVEISTVGGRTGIALRNELIFVFTGGGQPVMNGRYKLDIALQESVTPTQYEQISGRPASALQYMSATYFLTDKVTGKKLYQSRSFARTTYDQDIQRFANIRAARDAEDRAVKVLAQEIRNSLASYFAQAR